MSNSVSVQCPCGQSFEREAKRGRPAVWCEECRKVPVAQRAARPVFVDEAGEPVVSSDRVSRFGSHDKFSADERDDIEAGVLEVNEAYAAQDFAAMFSDADPRDIPFLMGDWQRKEYAKVYAKHDSGYTAY